MSQEEIRIAVVLGSVRPNNYTAMAARLAVDEFGRQGVLVDLVDPARLSLPGPGLGTGDGDPQRIREIVTAAAAVLLATPEYHGGFSSVIKLVIENLGFPSALAGKPVALLGVAAGAIGAVKSLEQLRGVCSHVGALPLPLTVSVANCQKVFDKDGNCLDPVIEKRVRGVATTVMDYLRKAVCPAITLERILRGEGEGS